MGLCLLCRVCAVCCVLCALCAACVLRWCGGGGGVRIVRAECIVRAVTCVLQVSLPHSSGTAMPVHVPSVSVCPCICECA